ncbi:MAG: YjgP/YjgQ family permease [Proteobacteria bacterium]|nr:YjgP/YjgQ family permease [Pseudomonadota bacterium]
MIPKLDRLIFGEIATLTLVILAILSTVMFLFRILTMTDYLVLTQDGIFSLLMFIIFVVPNILKLTLPLSLLFASAIVSMRMSGDREAEAWMSSGVSILRFCRAPLILGLVFALSASLSALWMEPYARQQWRIFRWIHARKGIESILENRLREKTFISDLFYGGGSKIALYVDSISQSKERFNGVFLGINEGNGERPSRVLTAASGRLRTDTDKGNYDYIFELYDGRLHQPTAAGGWNVANFDVFRISLVNMFQKQFEIGAFDSNDMRSYYPKRYITELKALRQRSDWGSSQRSVRDHTFFYEQIAVPLSCLFFPVIGVCLGIQDPRRKAGFAYLGILTVVFVFYALIMMSQQLAVKFIVIPEVSLILPLVSLSLMSLFVLIWRQRHPPSTSVPEFLTREFRKFSAPRRKGN